MTTKTNRRYQSDIPSGAKERLIADYKVNKSGRGIVIHPREVECVWRGLVVGMRYYDPEGTVVLEQPLKNGVRHGREYRWSDGVILSVEPYFEGKVHGTTKQFDKDGRIIGTYKMVHGTGLDVWGGMRCGDAECAYGVSEIRSMQDGHPHGYEWWFATENELSSERHWHLGEVHGIERAWNSEGRLRRGYPKYWMHNKQVIKRDYLKACETDKTLPPYRKEDDAPTRIFPKRVQKLLGIT